LYRLDPEMNDGDATPLRVHLGLEIALPAIPIVPYRVERSAVVGLLGRALSAPQTFTNFGLLHVDLLDGDITPST
jgi:hypothetical protein